MPKTKEKLIELLAEHCAFKEKRCVGCDEGKYYQPECKTNLFGNIADHLIANGVTVQECGHWEDDHGDYICSCCHTVFTDEIVWLVRGESNEPNYCPNCGAKMMPQPPKGE